MVENGAASFAECDGRDVCGTYFVLQCSILCESAEHRYLYDFEIDKGFLSRFRLCSFGSELF